MKKILLFGTLSVSISLAAATFEETYQQGITAIRQGKKQDALTLFQEAEKQATTPVQKTNALLQITWAMPATQELEALQLLLDYRQKAGKLPSPNEAMLELRIGVLQARQKKYEEAVQTLSFATGLNKLSDRDLLLAYDQLANAQLHLGKYEECLKTLTAWENLPTLSPNDYSRLLTRRACVLGLMKRFDEAYKTGTEAADVAGVSPINKALAWQMLAHVAFANEKNPQKAKIYSEKSQAVKNGQSGFNQKLHDNILKACEKNTP